MYWHAIQSSSKTDYLDRNIFIQDGTLDGGVDVIDASGLMLVRSNWRMDVLTLKLKFCLQDDF